MKSEILRKPSLRHLILQKSVAELLGCEPDFPSLRLAGIASQMFLRESVEFMMNREPGDVNSGWAFWQIQEKVTEETPCELKSLYELALYNMQIIPFLALPNGAKVTKQRGETILELGGKRISSNQNDSLRRIATAEFLV